MTRLVWTREKPTVPGWYWFRFTEDTIPEKFRDDDGPFDPYMNWVDQEDIDDPTPERLSDGEWAGPLPEPEEA